MATKLPLGLSLGRFSVRDIDRLNHASELLAAAVAGIERLSSPAALPLRHLIYDANNEVLAVMQKPAKNFQRWHEDRQVKPIEGETVGDTSETV